MAPRKLYFESIHVGDELPAMAKAPIDRVQLARYASAINDFNPLHVDEVQARAQGMPSVIAPSSLAMGFLGQLVTDWARGAVLRRIAVKFIRVLWPGDTLVCRGRVSDRHGQDGQYFLELDVWAENQKGELVVRGAATLKVFYSPEDESRARAGQPPIVVNVERQSILAPPPSPAPQAKATKPGAKQKPAKPSGKQKTAKAKAKPKAPKAKPKSAKATPKPAKAKAKPTPKPKAKAIKKKR